MADIGNTGSTELRDYRTQELLDEVARRAAASDWPSTAAYINRYLRDIKDDPDKLFEPRVPEPVTVTIYVDGEAHTTTHIPR